MSHKQLAAVLERGDTKACLAFFSKLSEKERQGHSPQVLAWFKPVAAQRFIEVKRGTFEPNPLLAAAEAALLASCSLSQLKKLGRASLPQLELAFEVLAARRPDWLDDWVERRGAGLAL